MNAAAVRAVDNPATATAAQDARETLARAIDRRLPQTQCARCDHPGCLAYARALAAGRADIDQCPPGGQVTIDALARLLGRAPLPFTPAHDARPQTASPPLNPAHGAPPPINPAHGASPQAASPHNAPPPLNLAHGAPPQATPPQAAPPRINLAHGAPLPLNPAQAASPQAASPLNPPHDAPPPPNPAQVAPPQTAPPPPNPAHDARSHDAPPQVARIREADCIGCALCIKACPVDCIIGAAKLMHSVITAECSGCELCLPACPTDCIVMMPRVVRPPGAPSIWREFTLVQVEKWRMRAAQKSRRARELETRRATRRHDLRRRALQREILAAVRRKQSGATRPPAYPGARPPA